MQEVVRGLPADLDREGVVEVEDHQEAEVKARCITVPSFQSVAYAQ